MKLWLSFWPSLTRADVPVYKCSINFNNIGGKPFPFIKRWRLHVAASGTQNGVQKGSSLNARIASRVDHDFVNPDWWGQWVLWSNGWSWVRRTGTNKHLARDSRSVMGSNCSILLFVPCPCIKKLWCPRARRTARYLSTKPCETDDAELDLQVRLHT